MRKFGLFALVMTLIMVLVGVFIGGCGSKKDTDGSQQTISITAAVTAPAEHPAGKSIIKFAELVEQNSDGRIKVMPALGGVMGSEREMSEALQLGNLQVGFISDIGMASVVPEIAFVNLPYLFNNYDQVKELYYNGWIGEEMSKRTLNKGIRILAFADNGFRGVSNSKRPIVGPDDLKGLKIRVPEFPMLLKFFEKLGTLPTPMAITELLTALQQKTVDGQDNGPILTYTFGLYQSQEYFTHTRHVYSGGGIEVSEKWWKTLSDADKQIIEEAAKEAASYQVDLSIQSESDSLKAMQEAGVQIDELNPEAQKRYKDVAVEVWKEFEDQFGKDVVDRLISELGQVQ